MWTLTALGARGPAVAEEDVLSMEAHPQVGPANFKAQFQPALAEAGILQQP